MEATEQQVIDLYCNTTASIMNMGRDIIPSTAVSEIFGCSVYKARKIIKNLISKGILEPACESEYSSWHEQYFICRGYRLTESARKSRDYRKAQWREAKLCSEVFGNGSPWSYYKSFTTDYSKMFEE